MIVLKLAGLFVAGYFCFYLLLIGINLAGMILAAIAGMFLRNRS